MARILIVDDDEEIREMLRDMLECEGYEIDEADDGNIGIEKYKQNQADLVITDIFMEEKGGIEMAIELQRDFPGVKIITISGGASGPPQEYLDMAKGFGSLRTLAKPIDMQELLTMVRELIAE